MIYCGTTRTSITAYGSYCSRLNNSLALDPTRAVAPVPVVEPRQDINHNYGNTSKDNVLDRKRESILGKIIDVLG